MKNAEQFLLEKIVGYKNNGYEVLGHLDGKFITPLSEIMREFAVETLIEGTNLLLKHKSVDLGDGRIIELQKSKSKPGHRR